MISWSDVFDLFLFVLAARSRKGARSSLPFVVKAATPSFMKAEGTMYDGSLAFSSGSVRVL